MTPQELVDELYDAVDNDDMCNRSYLVDEVEDLCAENAKLRELVRDMAAEIRGLGVDFKRVGWCDYADRMRELGVEA